jgi:hypothetical protein
METGRIMVQGYPGQKVSETLSQPTNQAWWFMLCSQLYRRPKVGGLQLRLALGEMWDPIWKRTKTTKAGGVVQVVKHLPSNLVWGGALSTNQKKKKKKVSWEDMVVSLVCLYSSTCNHDQDQSRMSKLPETLSWSFIKTRILTKRKSSIPTSHVLQIQRISVLCLLLSKTQFYN